MAAPTTRFRKIPLGTAATAVDTAAERLAAIADQAVVSTGDGNEADFGSVDITDGADNSVVQTILWDVTADGGNTTVETFKLWLSDEGFDQAGSVIKFRALSGADQVSASLTENYVVNAITTTYTFADMPATEPAQNVWPSDEGTSMALSTTSDDVVMWAMYAAIAASETPGTYKGTTADYQLQMSFKYTYS